MSLYKAMLNVKAKEERPTQPTRKTLKERQDADDIKEKLTVLAQPHRRGDRSDMTDALGAFISREFTRLEQDCARRCWDAGQKYIRKVSRWRRAKGIPQRVLMEDESSSGGGELDDLVVAEWGEEIRQCENAMKCSGLPGFRSANALVLDDVPPRPDQYGPVKRALIQLAICLGFFTEERRK